MFPKWRKKIKCDIPKWRQFCIPVTQERLQTREMYVNEPITGLFTSIY